MTSFHLGGRYGSYSAEKAAYWKHGYGVPINPRYRPGQNGRNWFVGAMEVADHGFSGTWLSPGRLAPPRLTRSTSTFSPTRRSVTTRRQSLHRPRRARFLQMQADDHRVRRVERVQYGLVRQVQVCLGRDAPAYPTLTTDDARELKSQIEAPRVRGRGGGRHHPRRGSPHLVPRPAHRGLHAGRAVRVRRDSRGRGRLPSRCPSSSTTDSTPTDSRTRRSPTSCSGCSRPPA